MLGHTSCNHIYEEWAANGEEGSSVVVTTDYDDAKRRFMRMLTEEMTDGIISANQDKSGFTVEEKKDFYSCWIDGEYWDFHYKLFIQEEMAVLTSRIAAQIGREYSDTVLRQEFYQQISDWQEVSDLTDEELNQLIQLPELPEMLREALNGHTSYWECYWETISDKAFHIIQDFRRKMGKTELSREDSDTIPTATKVTDNAYMLEISKTEFDAINTMTEKHRDISFAGEKYIIRPFKDWFDILKEGRVLRHIVAHYAKNRYGIGLDYLFAMRMVSNPEAPFITLEFNREGKLAQARKYNNYLANDPDEIAFIEEFRTKVLLPFIKENA